GHRAVHGDHPAERGQRVAGVRLAVRLGHVSAGRDAAREGVLDDRDGGLVGVVGGAQGGVGVRVVVVGHLLAVQLLGLGESARAGDVQGGRLVRVLAVPQGVLALPGGAQEVGELRVVDGRVVGGEPARDGDVVGGRVLERLGGEPLAGGEVEPAVADRGEDVAVAAGAGHHGDGGVVLGGGAHHRRTADVDLLDALVGRRARG